MDKLQQLRDKLNAGHSSKNTQTQKEWPFPNLKLSNLSAGSYPVRLLPMHPDKNPSGLVDFPHRIIPTAGKSLCYCFANEEVDPQDEAIHSKYFAQLCRLAYQFKEELNKLGFEKELKDLRGVKGVRVPAAIYCNKGLSWVEGSKYPNYSPTPAAPGKGEWFGVVLDITQKTVSEKILAEILGAWEPNEFELSEGIRPCDVFDPEAGRGFTFSKSGTGLNTVYDIKLSPAVTPINDQIKALYADGEYPDVLGQVMKNQKPKLDLISGFQQSKLAKTLLSMGIDVMQDPPVMITPKTPELNLSLAFE